MDLILSTAYLGNIQYYTKLLSGDAVIDTHEHYRKQSYRNRCEILTANGPASLIVPVLQPHGTKTSTRDIRIDYTKKWQHQHWQALISAYRSSPYLFYYEDRLAPFYQQRFEFLVDLNEALRELTFDLLKTAVTVRYSNAYLPEGDAGHDFRDALSPKVHRQSPDPTFVCAPYYQVFAERYPFAENLSIIDLLCCEGTHTDSIIRASTR